MRDALLGRPAGDIDLAVPRSGAVPFAEALARLGGSRAVAIGQPPRRILHVPLGRASVDIWETAGDLAADLLRRDFTVNALRAPLSRRAPRRARWGARRSSGAAPQAPAGRRPPRGPAPRRPRRPVPRTPPRLSSRPGGAPRAAPRGRRTRRRRARSAASPSWTRSWPRTRVLASRALARLEALGRARGAPARRSGRGATPRRRARRGGAAGADGPASSAERFSSRPRDRRRAVAALDALARAGTTAGSRRRSSRFLARRRAPSRRDAILLLREAAPFSLAAIAFFRGRTRRARPRPRPRSREAALRREARSAELSPPRRPLAAAGGRPTPRRLGARARRRARAARRGARDGGGPRPRATLARSCWTRAGRDCRDARPRARTV